MPCEYNDIEGNQPGSIFLLVSNVISNNTMHYWAWHFPEQANQAQQDGSPAINFFLFRI